MTASLAVDGLDHHAHREPREDTRARILDVALELIADQGFAATSTREISERLGFTKAALYYHFRTKDELLAAIVEPARRDLAALVEDEVARPSAAARRRVIEGYVALVAAHSGLIRVLADDPSIRRSGVLDDARPRYERLTQLLAGTETPDTAQRARVRAAMGAVHAALLRADPEDDVGTVRATAVAAACGALGLPQPRAVGS